jgi:hypothetical protein
MQNYHLTFRFLIKRVGATLVALESWEAKASPTPIIF